MYICVHAILIILEVMKCRNTDNIRKYVEIQMIYSIVRFYFIYFRVLVLVFITFFPELIFLKKLSSKVNEAFKQIFLGH